MASDELNNVEKKLANKKDKVVSFLDRLVLQAIADERVLGRQDDPAKTEFPELWKWLTKTDCPGDRVKQPATLMIRMGPEGVLVTISDRDLGATVDLSCAHLRDIWMACETELTSANPAIRLNPKKDPHVRKRKKNS